MSFLQALRELYLFSNFQCASVQIFAIILKNGEHRLLRQKQICSVEIKQHFVKLENVTAAQNNNSTLNGDRFIFNVELFGFNLKNIKIRTVGQKKVAIKVTQEDNNEENELISYSKFKFIKPYPSEKRLSRRYHVFIK